MPLLWRVPTTQHNSMPGIREKLRQLRQRQSLRVGVWERHRSSRITRLRSSRRVGVNNARMSLCPLLPSFMFSRPNWLRPQGTLRVRILFRVVPQNSHAPLFLFSSINQAYFVNAWWPCQERPHQRTSHPGSSQPRSSQPRSPQPRSYPLQPWSQTARRFATRLSVDSREPHRSSRTTRLHSPRR